MESLYVKLCMWYKYQQSTATYRLAIVIKYLYVTDIIYCKYEF